MASGPITSLQIEGGKVEAVIDFLFLGSNITVDGDCRHEVREWLVLGRKAMTNLDSMLKSRDITLPTKVRIVKVMIFPAVTYGCESWTLQKAEHQRTDAFKLWYWRRLLRFLWTMMGSNQSILNKINPEYSWKDCCWCWRSSHPIWTANSLEKTLMLEKIEGRRRRKHQSMRWQDGATDATDLNLANFGKRWGAGRPGVLRSVGSQRIRHDWVTEQQQRGPFVTINEQVSIYYY